MAVDMTPSPDKSSINLPITFDYKGGRGQNLKNKLIYSFITVVLTIGLAVILALNGDIILWMRVLLPIAVLYLGLIILRYAVWNEIRYSDLVESLIEQNYRLQVEDIWQIFEVSDEPPYICYFRNGLKGIFIRMEKDAIVGKPDTNQFDHYTAIGDAYNIAHSLNMNIVHIDYMDTVGNDSRMKAMYESLETVENEDMHYALKLMYDHLSTEMKSNYACFDIYLFLTRDDITNFVYNVQAVASQMLGGNFITYRYMRKSELGRVCESLFNLNEFDEYSACEKNVETRSSSFIIPISVTHYDGSVEKLNKTREEKRILAEEAEHAKAAKKQRKSKSSKTHSDEIDLF